MWVDDGRRWRRCLSLLATEFGGVSGGRSLGVAAEHAAVVVVAVGGDGDVANVVGGGGGGGGGDLAGGDAVFC